MAPCLRACLLRAFRRPDREHRANMDAVIHLLLASMTVGRHSTHLHFVTCRAAEDGDRGCRGRERRRSQVGSLVRQ